MHFTVCVVRFCRFWPQEKPNKNTGMKRASYFRHNILEQCKEVTTGENLHEIALGTDEVSSHLSAQTHKYISTHNHHSHILFLYPATVLFTGLWQFWSIVAALQKNFLFWFQILPWVLPVDLCLQSCSDTLTGEWMEIFLAFAQSLCKTCKWKLDYLNICSSVGYLCSEKEKNLKI